MSSAITPSLQNATYVAINLQGILYGVELVLYVETMHAGLTRRKKQRGDIVHMLLSTVMLILITISVSMNAIFAEQICVIYTGYSCETSTYLESSSTAAVVWYLSLGRATVFVLQLMTDAILIHRCWAIWGKATVVIFPSILWFAALVLGVVQTYMFDSVVKTFLPRLASSISLAYFATCIFLNMTLTLLISYRIIRHGRLVRDLLGREYSSVYFAVAEIMVESALPYTLSGIVFLVIQGLRSQAVIPSAWVYFMMTCISPQMLILRVMKRKHLHQGTNKSVASSVATSIRFQHLPDTRAGEEPEGTLQLQPLSKTYLASRGDFDGGAIAGIAA